MCIRDSLSILGQLDLRNKFSGCLILNRSQLVPVSYTHLLQMDADWYDRYIQYGYEIKPETLNKLKAMQGTEPLMEKLIEHILKGKMGIEQECFLI